MRHVPLIVPLQLDTPPPGGNVWSINLGDASNCQVDIVWGEKDSTYVVTENQIDQGVFGVESTCFTSEDASTGGYAVDVGGRFQASLPDTDRTFKIFAN